MIVIVISTILKMRNVKNEYLFTNRNTKENLNVFLINSQELFTMYHINDS